MTVKLRVRALRHHVVTRGGETAYVVLKGMTGRLHGLAPQGDPRGLALSVMWDHHVIPDDEVEREGGTVVEPGWNDVTVPLDLVEVIGP